MSAFNSVGVFSLFLKITQVRELLSQKLSSWQQSCSQPTKLPERALNLLRHTAPQSSGAAGIAEVMRHTKLGSAQPEQVSPGWMFEVYCGCRMKSPMRF